MKRTLCAILILFWFSGCHISANNITHIWFYTYSEGTSDSTSLTPANFLECRKDGSYTRDFGRFDYGNWRMEGSQLYLTDHEHHTSIYPLDMTKPKEMQMTIQPHYKAIFDRLPLPDDDGKDPFSLANNRWRIPAAHKESDAEIRRRLHDHCRFWETYFAWALDASVETIDVRSTPSPIKIYGNGFTLKPIDDLPAAWKGYFYDAEDCAKANDIIESIFRTRNIAWAHTDNKYKLFLGAFQQMESFLK